MGRNDTMGDRLKGFESSVDFRLDSGSLWALRLDGNAFSKFTKKIRAEKPFDIFLMEAMREVCKNLLIRFDFATVYSQSDEITCIPYFFGDGREEKFGLRIQKLVSLTAAAATAEFNRQMQATAMFDNVVAWMDELPIFDSRVIPLEEDMDLLRCLVWRQRDCEKNSKNLVGQQFFSHKQLQGLTADEQIGRVYLENGIEWEDYPEEFRQGVFVKKEQYQHVGWNPKLEREEISVRGRPRFFTKRLGFTPEDLDLITRKYY